MRYLSIVVDVKGAVDGKLIYWGQNLEVWAWESGRGYILEPSPALITYPHILSLDL